VETRSNGLPAGCSALRRNPLQVSTVTLQFGYAVRICRDIVARFLGQPQAA